MVRVRSRWLALAVLLIGFFMILLDSTIVNVSIPTIIKELHANLSQVEWIISGYALSFAALLITFGRLGDLYGRKKLFMLGLAVFTIASIFSGEATNPTTLIAARLFQGVGGAMLSPATLSIISSTFRDRERALAFGAFGAVSGIASAIGPILGGWITTYYSWRWIFRVNIPIGIVGLVLAWLIVTDSKAEKSEKLDISGMITSGFGFFFLVFALIEGQTYGWLKPANDFVLGGFTWASSRSISIIPICFALSLAFLISFMVIQSIKTRRKASPAVNVSFFKSGAFKYGLVAIAIIALGEFSTLFTLPIFLQSVKEFSPLKSGYGFLPLALSAMIGAPLSALMVNKIGTKWVITTGITLEAIGLILLTRINADISYIMLVPGLVVFGFGLGLAISQNTQVILSEINPIHAGSASGVLNTVRQVGTALGIAIIGAVLANQASVKIPNQIRTADLPGISSDVREQIIAKAGANGSSYTTGNIDVSSFTPTIPANIAQNPIFVAQYNAEIAQTTKNLRKAIDVGLSDSIATSVKVGAAFMILGALSSLLIPNVLAKKEEDLVG
jgi:EmrB/QacA subfamily drug resistance transporter